MSDTQDEEGNGELESPVGGVKAEEGIDSVDEIVVPSIEEIYTQPQSQSKPQSKSASVRRIQKSINDISKQVENQMAQINRANQVVQKLQKQTKSSQRQSDVLNQIKSKVNQIQRQVTQVQKIVQKKAVDSSSRKSMKKKRVSKSSE